MASEAGLDLQRIPSSAVGSYRSTSPEQSAETAKLWDKVKKYVVNNAMVAVGLRPTREESRHWDVVKGVVLSNRREGQASEIQASHHPKDTLLVRHVSRRDFGRTVPDGDETDGAPLSPPTSFFGRPISLPGRQMSVRSFKADKVTGRSQVFPADPKPDLWKLALNTIKATQIKRRGVDVGISVNERSFDFPADEQEADEPDYAISGSKIMKPEEDQFFGEERVPPKIVSDGVTTDGEEEVDFALSSFLKPDSIRREKIKEVVDKVTFGGGYRGGFGGLGTVTKLLDFKYNFMSSELLRELDHLLLHKRPYFTYWLMTVHVLIMIVALGLYGFAPYGWDLIENRQRVRQTDLSFATVSKLVVPSVWGGPPQQALVLLGALFAPCMRHDRQLFEGINRDREMERNNSGCCVRRDGSGCFQTEDRSECQERFSDFLLQKDNGVRSVCGTSPEFCREPSPDFSDGVWVPNDVLTWPICRDDENEASTDANLLCEITSRPCCYGIQAICIITTREFCTFLNGRFHQEAFLCSQVSCLDEICGLLPFARFNEPDQVYRLWIALFLHAGLIHLALSLLFSFFVLRHIEKRLGWVRTAVLYVFSGIGGNLVSAYFAPYNPEVGPAGSILGVVAYFFVFLIFESPMLERPWIEALKLTAVSVFLLVLGVIPYVDNYAHVGGFLFGFLISGILVSYGNFKEMWALTDQEEKDVRGYKAVKWVMVLLGFPVLLLLYALLLILLYAVQSTVPWFSYLTCVPFTDTLCIDQQVLIRDRDTFIV